MSAITSLENNFKALEGTTFGIDDLCNAARAAQSTEGRNALSGEYAEDIVC